MNVTKNGIPIHSPISRNFGKPYRATVNPHKRYVTLFRLEDLDPVWLVIPLIGKELNQLKREGWKVVEVWEKKQ